MAISLGVYPILEFAVAAADSYPVAGSLILPTASARHLGKRGIMTASRATKIATAPGRWKFTARMCADP